MNEPEKDFLESGLRLWNSMTCLQPHKKSERNMKAISLFFYSRIRQGAQNGMFSQFPQCLTYFSLSVGGYFLALSRELHTLLGTDKIKVAGVSWAWFILLFMFWFSIELYKLSSRVHSHSRQRKTFISLLYAVQCQNGLLVKALKYYSDGCFINIQPSRCYRQNFVFLFGKQKL